MMCNMHRRPCCPINDSIYPSIPFTHSTNTSALNDCTCSPSFDHDQVPSPKAPRRRRRLEDLIVIRASNYYATIPNQTSSLSSSQSPPIPSSRRIYEQSENSGIHCDLYNLLEPSAILPPPEKQRQKYPPKDYRLCCHRSSINVHTKMNNVNERKRHLYQQQQSFSCKQKWHQEDDLSQCDNSINSRKIKQIINAFINEVKFLLGYFSARFLSNKYIIFNICSRSVNMRVGSSKRIIY